MNLLEIIGIARECINLVSDMSETKIKALFYGIAVMGLGWRLPDLVQAVRWW